MKIRLNLKNTSAKRKYVTSESSWRFLPPLDVLSLFLQHLWIFNIKRVLKNSIKETNYRTEFSSSTHIWMIFRKTFTSSSSAALSNTHFDTLSFGKTHEHNHLFMAIGSSPTQNNMGFNRVSNEFKRCKICNILNVWIMHELIMARSWQATS